MIETHPENVDPLEISWGKDHPQHPGNTFEPLNMIDNCLVDWLISWDQWVAHLLHLFIFGIVISHRGTRKHHHGMGWKSLFFRISWPWQWPVTGPTWSDPSLVRVVHRFSRLVPLAMNGLLVASGKRLQLAKWNDPPCYQWVNPLFRLGHGFNVANCNSHYPLVIYYIAMDNHHFSWENPLFLWPFSIAFCMFTRGYQAG